MKIEIMMGTEIVRCDSTIQSELRPVVKASVEFTEEELKAVKKVSHELFEAITRLINFSVQHMM